MYKPGQRLIFCGDMASPEELVAVECVKSNDMTSTVRQIAGQQKVDTTEVYNHSLFPEEYAAELRSILEKRQALKKDFDNSMQLLYRLRNKITLESNK